MLDIEKKLSYSLDDIIKEERQIRRGSGPKLNKSSTRRFSHRPPKHNEKLSLASNKKDNINQRLDSSLAVIIQEQKGQLKPSQKKKNNTPRHPRNVQRLSAVEHWIKTSKNSSNFLNKKKSVLSSRRLGGGGVERNNKNKVPFSASAPVLLQKNKLNMKKKISTQRLMLNPVNGLPTLPSKMLWDSTHPLLAPRQRNFRKRLSSSRQSSLANNALQARDLDQIQIVTELSRVPEPLIAQMNYPSVRIDGTTHFMSRTSFMTPNERFSK